MRASHAWALLPLLTLLDMPSAFGVHTSSCHQIRELDLAAHPSDYQLLRRLKEECENELAQSPDASLRATIAGSSLDKEFAAAHRTRLAVREQLLNRAAAIIAELRASKSDQQNPPSDTFYAVRADELSSLVLNAKSERTKNLRAYLQSTLRQDLETPDLESDEAIALQNALQQRVAAYAAQSDQQTEAVDRRLDAMLSEAAATVRRLRLTATVRFARQIDEEIAAAASDVANSIRADTAWQRFASASKIEQILQDALVRTNAGMLAAAETRMQYAEQAHARFMAGLPSITKEVVIARHSTDLLGSIAALRKAGQQMTPQDAERRTAAYLKFRFGQYTKNRDRCLAKYPSQRASLLRLEKDVAALTDLRNAIPDAGVRAIVLESVANRADIANELCRGL